MLIIMPTQLQTICCRSCCCKQIASSCCRCSIKYANSFKCVSTWPSSKSNWQRHARFIYLYLPFCLAHAYFDIEKFIAKCSGRRRHWVANRLIGRSTPVCSWVWVTRRPPTAELQVAATPTSNCRGSCLSGPEHGSTFNLWAATDQMGFFCSHTLTTSL